LVLCELNDVQKPELPEWRQISKAEEARFAASIGERMPLVARSRANALSASRQGQSSQGRSVRKPKAVSKRERKKRAAQRKGRQKRKKRRKNRSTTKALMMPRNTNKPFAVFGDRASLR
jgi:hypothetical protein